MKAVGTYGVKKWEENAYEQISSDMKMTKASVEYSMTGEIIGKALVEYLMFYKYFDAKDQHKSSAMYIGLMRFVGSVQGKEGSFVMEDHGAFESGGASSTLHIVAGSGLGELKDIQGTGRYSANLNSIHIELDYNL
jgi:hypothetical protein